MSKDTLQLPKTAFSMKASLPLKEPEILKKWEKSKIFEKLRKKSKGKQKFIRPEKKFKNLENLKKQIRLDIKQAKK